MIATSTLLWFARANGIPSDDVIVTLARYHTVYLWQYTDQHTTVGGELDLSWVDAIAARIRAVNPKTRIGLYGGPIGMSSDIDPSYGWLSDAELLPDANGSPLIYHDPANNRSTFRFPNLLDPAVRQRLIDKWCGLCIDHGFDALLLDDFDPSFYATLVREAPPTGYFGLPNGIGPGGAWRMDQTVWWDNVIGAYSDTLRWELEERGVSLSVNGLFPSPYDPTNLAHAWAGYGNSNFVDHASEALIEHCVEGYGNPPMFRDLLKTIKLATDKRRRVTALAFPWFLQQSIPTIDNLGFQRFMLAMYLLVQEVPYTSFGYSDVQPFRGWSGPSYAPGDWVANGYDNGPGTPYAFWSPDWERDYGTPLETYQTANDANGTLRLAWRSYTRGRTATDYVLVVVNPTTEPQATTFGGTWRVWGDISHTVSGPITVPAQTGWVLWQQP